MQNVILIIMLCFWFWVSGYERKKERKVVVVVIVVESVREELYIYIERKKDGKSFWVCKGGESLLMIDCYLVAPSASISVNDVFL
jgi:hypothetical protein